MANSRDILLKLVRIAMGWEVDFSLPKDVDWKEVLSLSQEQGVNAIAVDGLEIWMKKVPQLLSSSKDKQILLEAIGLLQMVEVNNLHQLSALKKLSQILSGKEIPFMIMKGFACAQYYPNPQHRPCGDIDIYPGDRFQESNQALQEAGVNVDPHYYRHSVSYINGIMIENHCVLGDLRGPKKQTRMFECLLEELAKKSIGLGGKAYVGDQEIYCGVFPSADFNALFLPWHLSAHLEFERVTLRHLLDWALFISHKGKDVNLDLFSNAKKTYTFGYGKIADILTSLSLRYLKMPVGDIPLRIIEEAVNVDDHLSDKVFNYMFDGVPRERNSNIWLFRLNNVKRIFNEGWKYKEIYGVSSIKFLLYKIRGAFFNVGDDYIYKNKCKKTI